MKDKEAREVIGKLARALGYSVLEAADFDTYCPGSLNKIQRIEERLDAIYAELTALADTLGYEFEDAPPVRAIKKGKMYNPPDGISDWAAKDQKMTQFEQDNEEYIARLVLERLRDYRDAIKIIQSILADMMDSLQPAPQKTDDEIPFEHNF